MIKNVSLLTAILLSYNISAMLYTPIKLPSRALPTIARRVAQHTQSTYPAPANTLANHVQNLLRVAQKVVE